MPGARCKLSFAQLQLSSGLGLCGAVLVLPGPVPPGRSSSMPGLLATSSSLGSSHSSSSPHTNVGNLRISSREPPTAQAVLGGAPRPAGYCCTCRGVRSRQDVDDTAHMCHSMQGSGKHSNQIMPSGKCVTGAKFAGVHCSWHLLRCLPTATCGHRVSGSQT
jgi:hypothetical protein